MKLYHGSYLKIDHIDLAKSRPFKDFGRGFYTTSQKEQAEHWTSIKIDRAKVGRRVVSVFELDEKVFL